MFEITALNSTCGKQETLFGAIRVAMALSAMYHMAVDVIDTATAEIMFSAENGFATYDSRPTDNRFVNQD